MPDLERDGWRLWFEQAGAGPPVVLVHGLLMDRTMFDQQVSALSERYRFVLPDLRGHAVRLTGRYATACVAQRQVAVTRRGLDSPPLWTYPQE